ncbi:hypothetical protein Q3G72_016050 [Acer saccharum]|nr:hypothetical protein Q3G72_016050 [Acer saccharum]
MNSGLSSGVSCILLVDDAIVFFKESSKKFRGPVHEENLPMNSGRSSGVSRILLVDDAIVFFKESSKKFSGPVHEENLPMNSGRSSGVSHRNVMDCLSLGMSLYKGCWMDLSICLAIWGLDFSAKDLRCAFENARASSNG